MILIFIVAELTKKHEEISRETYEMVKKSYSAWESN